MRPDAPSDAETGAGGSMTTRPPRSGGPTGRKPQAGKFSTSKFRGGKAQADGRARTGPRTSARDAAERAARNRFVPVHADNLGFIPEVGPICAGPETLESRLPLNAIHKELSAAGLPVEWSDDAGGYLCNAVFTLSLARGAEDFHPAMSGFIHVPPLRAQEGRFMAGGRSNLTLPQLVRAAERAIVTAAAAARRKRVARKLSGRISALMRVAR